MKVLYGLEELQRPLARSVLTIGNFDGVHLAHQKLIAQAGLFAAQTGEPLVVLTFEPHPYAIVAPQKVPPRLTSLSDKLDLLAIHGTEITVVARSEPALLSMEAEDFVRAVICERFHPTHMVEGPTFGFGKGRRGDVALLQREAAKFGCVVHVADPVRLAFDHQQAVMVSSSLIRDLLAEGHVRRAAMCLGRTYSVTGRVVQGDQRGRSLGFPTANLGDVEQMIPGDGVYTGVAVVEGERYPAAISIGRAATFGGTERRVEAHLLDFADDIYGRPIRVEFERFVRAQQKFDSKDALVRQLRLDVQAARAADGSPEHESADSLSTRI